MPSLTFALVPSIVIDATAVAAAAAVVRDKMHDRRASVEVSFDGGSDDFGFLVFSGIEALADRLERQWLTEADQALIKLQAGLDDDIRETLRSLRCTLDIDAPPEGTVVFAREPVVNIEGPLVQVLLIAPLVESLLGLATTVATRAARLRLAAAGDLVVDASSGAAPDPGLLVARAAHIGGCGATTQPVASPMLGIPVHATAPRAIAELVGAGTGAQNWGATPADEPRTLSSTGDEALELAERRRAGERGIWLARGLARGASLSSRYDLVALEQGRSWVPRMGIAPDPRVLPGRKQVVRYADGTGAPRADLVQLAAERVQAADDARLVPEPGPGFAMPLDKGLVPSPLRVAVLRSGRRSGSADLVADASARSEKLVSALDPIYRRLRGAERFRVGISRGVLELRATMLAP